MTHLTRLSLANRLIVGLLTLGILVLGVSSVFALKQELIPEIQAPTALVTARYPGTSPQIVATEVATPLEQSLTAVSGVTKASSTSSNGVAVITVEWDYGLDADTLLSDIRGAVDRVPDLPDAVQTDVAVANTNDIPVLQLAVSADGPLEQAGQRVDDIAVPALQAVEGVRQVVLTGQNQTRLAVTLRPADLREHDLTAQGVTQVLQAQTNVVPAGTSYDKNIELAVEVGNEPTSVRSVRAIPVATSDGPVPLSQLADVRVEAVESSSVARSNGRPAFSLVVQKETDADAVEISHAVVDQVPDLERRLGSGARIVTVFDQAPLIEQSIHDLAVEGGLGLVFAVLVILLFLLSVRSTIITAVSIPLSLMIALIGLRAGGYSLNIFTLAALTVAVGRVVDDSIVVVENLKRRSVGHPDLGPADIVAAVKEVAGAVTASTLTTIAVFLPVAIVSGITGELFRPFAVTIAVALVGSLLVSLTIVPVLAYWLLRRRRGAPASAGTEPTGEEVRVTRLQRGYLPVLHGALRHPWLTLVAAALVFIGTLGGSTLLKTDFLGSFADEHTLQIAQELPAGTRLETTSEAAEKVEALLAGSPQVKSYLTTVGGGGIPGVVADSGANAATITVTLADGLKASTEKEPLRRQLEQLTGVGELTVSTTDSGASNSDVSVVVSADNSDALRRGADEVQQLVAATPGLGEVRSDLADQRKVLQVDVDLERAARKGFTQAEVGQAVAGALTGTEVGTVELSGESRDILLRTQANDATPADIGRLELPVSQLQQADATEQAADRLKDRQKRASDEAAAEADEAVADQESTLREQRAKAVDALDETRQALRRLKANPPKRPSGVPVPNVAAATLPGGPRAAAVPSCEPADATDPSDPADLCTLARAVAIAQSAALQAAKVAATAAAQAAIAQGQVAGLQAQAAAQAYGQQAAQYATQVSQLEATIEQTDKTVEQLDEQLEATAEQADRAADQRAEQEDLAQEQEDIADVRAKPIRVRDVADVKTVLAPTTVRQVDAIPTVTVTATPTGSDLGAISTTLQQRLDGAELPAGVTASLGGASEDQADAFRQLGLAMLVAIGLVFVIMVATFRSLAQPLILLVSIPFAATGALVGLLVTDTPLGVPSMIGLLMLIGIVVTNAIVLIDLINQYRARGEDVETAVVEGARLRLRPIIMTAAATICALVPMGLGLTGGGAFISQPLAVVVIGGLLSSTVLTLLLVPVLYLLIERSGERRRARRAQRAAVV